MTTRLRRVAGARFVRAVAHAAVELRNGRPVIETLGRYSLEEYAAMACYLADDGSAGYAVKADGDLVSVFNIGPSRRGDEIVRHAIRHGATHLDAFDEDGFLPALYARHGFREVGREPWNDAYAPPAWTGARPDVVYMKLEGSL